MEIWKKKAIYKRGLLKKNLEFFKYENNNNRY